MLKKSMKKYEILEHKADLKIRAFGATKHELFLNSVLGMEESMQYEVRKPEEKVKRQVKVSSPDFTVLLVDFLSEVLYLTQVNKEVYDSVKFEKFSDPSTSSGQAEIKAELSGKKIERFGLDIKAVTHHQLDISQKKNGIWEAVIIFDI